MNTSTLSLKRSIDNTPSPAKNPHSLLNIAEQLSLFGSVVGAVVSSVSGQFAYATLPLSLSVVLMSEANRRRCELLQQSQQAIAADVQRHSNSLQYQLEQLQTALTQLQQSPQKYLTKTHLTPIISKLHQLQRQLKVIEISQIETLAQQVKELQQQIEDLDASESALHDRTRNFEQLQQQLVEIQRQLPSRIQLKSPHRKQGDRVAIFIDAANIYHAASELGINIDYNQLRSVLTGKSTISKASLYTGVDPDNDLQKSFLSSMQRQGYQIVSKKVMRRADGSRKANLDMELGLDMVDLADTYDTAILVSGDGDFTYAVKKVQSLGKRVEVVSFRSSTSFELIEVADSYLDMKNILDEICHSPRSPRTDSPLAVVPPKHQTKVKNTN